MALRSPFHADFAKYIYTPPPERLMLVRGFWILRSPLTPNSTPIHMSDYFF